MKSPIILRLILLVGLLISGAGISPAAQGAEPLVLARVEMTEAMTRARQRLRHRAGTAPRRPRQRRALRAGGVR